MRRARLKSYAKAWDLFSAVWLSYAPAAGERFEGEDVGYVPEHWLVLGLLIAPRQPTPAQRHGFAGPLVREDMTLIPALPLTQ